MVAVVPAHDEAGGVGETVAALRAIRDVEHVVVVADGCRDRTVAVALEAGASVLAAPDRLGKGGAMERALDSLPQAGVYLLVDADVRETAAEAARLLIPVIAGQADLAIGRLPALQGGGFGLVRRAAWWSIRRTSGFEAREPLSGQRAVTAKCLHACRPLGDGFGLETAMTIDATRLGFRVVEVPVAMRHRATGRTLQGFVHRAGQGVDIARAVAPRLLGIR